MRRCGPKRDAARAAERGARCRRNCDSAGPEPRCLARTGGRPGEAGMRRAFRYEAEQGFHDVCAHS
ncbi:hypothetical protein C7S16_5789 [Burkholderia thailandensis]|uniref:Uncharacterized protein n=1 Tax=Burkholderia thailandensis TaxID=57975 RepID=A0AAW9CSR0_BURTH|nr:hypothetical protein [Burkholderia thailandensis]MDW9250796.1 hypothetical protein [Burkholderia thailandensis]